MKIDFVILWVDGNDKDWQAEKNKYQKQVSKSNTDSSIARYRDWGLLKYWFRAIEKNAPWVNKIFFVTNGQKPAWLNLANKKLVHVTHADFMPERYLPTFNANPIELNLHRIKELSETFVYFNDDMFLIDKVKPTFFFKKGLPRDAAAITPFMTDDSSISTHMIVNDLECINKAYNKNEVIKKNKSKWINPLYGEKMLRTVMMMPFHEFAGIYFDHMPTSFTKKEYLNAWGRYGNILEKTSNNKFRSKEDVNQWLIKADRICQGDFSPRKPSFGESITISEDSIDKIGDIIHNRKKTIVCLNDSSDMSNFGALKTKLTNIFDNEYPTKSSFEI